ncbi:hypothetical protein HYH02_003363 [Chlamydomonas schloesseri]|uniref:Protein kinase domain-containing protein n=1 Tax=Chlamydomonas schloesseri TaxID=2026947 RepID=A0A835WQQ0_9CHLO|nr:hypothetical protein HYH02_003363 [Chlamydomonas schloesseri]|eukprot:KAG2452339.1 hypothetical protein HYH02_003363 [Chlamydomonas schloesseri]
MLTLDSLLVRRTRSDPSFRAPGFDLLTDDSGRDPNINGSFSAMVVRRSINLQEICMPPSYVPKAGLGSFARPKELPPGRQITSNNGTIRQLHPNCSGSYSPSLPYEQQCIASAGGLFTDVGVYCYSLDVYGNQVKTGYVSHLLNCENRCYQYMTMSCLETWGDVVGCYNFMMQQRQNQTEADAVAPPVPPSISVALVNDPGSGGGGSSRDMTPVIVGVVVGGVMGAILLAAGALWAFVLLRRRGGRYAAGAGAAAAAGNKPADSESGHCWGLYHHGDAAASSRTATTAVDDMDGAVLEAGKTADKGDGSGSGGFTGGSTFDSENVHANLRSAAAAAAGYAAAGSLAAAAADAPASLMPVTPLTPLNPHIPLNVINVSDLDSSAAGSVASGGPPTMAADAKPGAGDSGPGGHHQSLLSHQLHVVLTGVVMGRGSFGKVLEGTYGGRKVAVKQIDTGLVMQLQQQQAQQAQQAQQRAQSEGPPKQQPQTDSLRAQDAILVALEQEVAILARVQHQNIVTLLAANLKPPNVCLVMERMDMSLDRLMYHDPNRPFPLSLALHIALQVARALEYLHPTIIHRDLPANVLISNADSRDEQQVVVKLADFGLSRLRDTVLITQQPEVGTGPYMAPECFDLEVVGITDRADCYSFGVLLWELIARRRPWEEMTMMKLAVAVTMRGERLPMLPLVQAGAPPKLVRLVTQCFEADSQRRPAAAEIVKELLLVQQQLAAGSDE